MRTFRKKKTIILWIQLQLVSQTYVIMRESYYSIAAGECVRPIPVLEFISHVERLHADRDKLFEMEYEVSAIQVVCVCACVCVCVGVCVCTYLHLVYVCNNFVFNFGTHFKFSKLCVLGAGDNHIVHFVHHSCVVS